MAAVTARADHDDRHNPERSNGLDDQIPAFGGLGDPVEADDLSLRQRAEVVAEALDRVIVGNHRRERVGAWPVIAADNDGLVDPCDQRRVRRG
ncbi:hypothetical protein [Kribbella steppae]|uniref:hypothetical protein n=1 Tax=Kribbella steppae TaxID=2512223 RepID=UPI00104F17E0|nr:hypothetical protein [Kribbella steppae]